MSKISWKAEALGRRPMPSAIFSDVTTLGDPIYFARCSTLTGCVAQGNTVNEAFDNLIEARIDYLHSMLEHGLELPIDDAEYGSSRKRAGR